MPVYSIRMPSSIFVEADALDCAIEVLEEIIMELLQLSQTDAREVPSSEVEALGIRDKLFDPLRAAVVWEDA